MPATDTTYASRLGYALQPELDTIHHAAERNASRLGYALQPELVDPHGCLVQHASRLGYALQPELLWDDRLRDLMLADWDMRFNRNRAKLQHMRTGC